eukprot:scaffold331570_cov39-Prasinocladus_malaysianus.AAC.1
MMAMQSDLSEAIAHRQSLIKQLEESLGGRTTLECEAESLKESTAALRLRVAELEAKLESSAAAAQVSDTEVKRLRDAENELRKESAERADSLSKAEAACSELRAQLEQAAVGKESVVAQLEEALRERANLESDLASFKASNAQGTETSAQQLAHIQSLEEEIANLQSK